MASLGRTDQQTGRNPRWMIDGGLVALRKRQLTAEEILVVLVLLAHCKPGLQKVRITQPDIARALGRDVANVRKSLGRLSRAGLLVARTHGTGGGRVVSYDLGPVLSVLGEVVRAQAMTQSTLSRRSPGALRRKNEIIRRKMNLEERVAAPRTQTEPYTRTLVLKAQIQALEWVLGERSTPDDEEDVQDVE